jgi:hypothetical protein
VSERIGLIDFDDVAYDEHANLLYDLAERVTRHLWSYLSEEAVRKVLRLHQGEISGFVHAQMQQHFWQDARVDYDVVVTLHVSAAEWRFASGGNFQIMHVDFSFGTGALGRRRKR